MAVQLRDHEREFNPDAAALLGLPVPMWGKWKWGDDLAFNFR